MNVVQANSLPLFDELPAVHGAPKGCAWGLFDKDGVKDQLGTVNLLSPLVVLEASKEIKNGQSVALNWGLENPPSPFYRERFQQRVKDVGKEYDMPISCLDDILTFNTQSSSQWDGFRHWGHSKTGQHYNGVPHEQLADTDAGSIHYWTERGGIIGRGVLVDFAGWAKRNGVTIVPNSCQRVSLATIKAILEEEKVTIQPGDILIIRTGLIQAYNQCASDEDRDSLMRSSQTIGVEATEDMLRWLWNQHFAAVAGDAVAFETQPYSGDVVLHDYLLVWWGMPIGELWDLEALAAKCQELERWTFFLTSAPLNVKGGVASPPNALAIF